MKDKLFITHNLNTTQIIYNPLLRLIPRVSPDFPTMKIRSICSVAIVIMLSIDCEGATVPIKPSGVFQSAFSDYILGFFKKLIRRDPKYSSTVSESTPVTEETDNILGAAIVNFSFRLMRKLYEIDPNENLLVSPPSILRALMSTYSGCDGETISKLAEVLKLSNHHKTVAQLRDKLNNLFVRGVEEGVVEERGVEEGEVLYYDGSFHLEKQIETLFRNKVSQIDFRGDDDIDKWVQDTTAGKMKTLARRIDPRTRVMLLSVIHMKKSWRVKFDPTYTAKRDFLSSGGTVAKVSFIQKEDNYGYVADEEIGCHIFSIPFAEDDLSFVIIVPGPNSKVGEVIQSLNHENLRNNLDNLRNHTLTLVLPKFTVGKEVRLRPILESLGLSGVFPYSGGDRQESEGDRQESGVFPQSRGDRQESRGDNQESDRLFLDEFAHKAVLTIDEEGRHVAKVTERMFSPRNYGSHFLADSPFIYMVYSEITKFPLFIGTMVNVEESSQF